MLRYLLPEDRGGAEVEMLTDQEPTRLVRDYVWVRDPRLGLIQIDRNKLHVQVTIPTEPPPGAYLIGGHLAVLFKGSTGRNRWSWETPVEEGTGDTWDYGDWDNCWNECGGPDVTIQRLVPEPAKVELPWHGGPFAVEYSPRGMGSGTPHTVAVDTIGDRRYIRPSVAREMAAALLTAAGAQ